MKVVILAGGKGSRIEEYTKSIPKPMIRIGSKPIIEHIINYYMKFGFNDFIKIIQFVMTMKIRPHQNRNIVIEF